MSPGMSLDQIDAALQDESVPLGADSFARRAEVLDQLDRHLSAADSELDPAVIAYYRRRVDRVLDQVAATAVSEGVVLWKLYSSGVLLKTPQVVVGIDLCEGPNEDMFGREQVPFGLTGLQRQRLADAVQYSFHTHHHYDHLSHALVQLMAARGAPIFVTEQHRRLWRDEPFAGQLRLLEPEAAPLAVGPLEVRAFYGHQGSDQCYAFHIATDSGVSIWTKGDVYNGDEHAGFLARLAGAGARMDLFVSSTWTKRGVDIIGETRRLFDPVFVPSHDWEFTHRRSGTAGQATQSHGHNRGVLADDGDRAVLLSWGESLHYAPARAGS